MLEHMPHRIRVELCGSIDGLSCHSDWSQGWLLREAKNESPLSITRLSSDKKRLKWKGFQAKIQFHSNGSSPIGNGRFYSCYKQHISWQLILNRQGRLRTASKSENEAENARCT